MKPMKWNNRWMLMAVALLALLATGCGGAAMMDAGQYSKAAPMDAGFAMPEADDGAMAALDEPVGSPGPLPPPGPPPPPGPLPGPDTRHDAGDASSGTGTATKAAPMLIYTANYHLAVFETAKVIDAIQKLADEQGGYLVRRGDNNITVRIPSGKFRGVLGAISKLGDVLHREESVEDVTERFFDLQVRLKNARAVRQRLEALLLDAKDVKEALAVEKELARLTAEIESLAGKLKRMRELIAFSTITVQLEPRATDSVDPNVRLPFPWLEQLGLSNLMNL